MTSLLIGAAIGAIVKTLLPWPAMDDRVRAGWRGVAGWVRTFWT